MRAAQKMVILIELSSKIQVTVVDRTVTASVIGDPHVDVVLEVVVGDRYPDPTSNQLHAAS